MLASLTLEIHQGLELPAIVFGLLAVEGGLAYERNAPETVLSRRREQVTARLLTLFIVKLLQACLLLGEILLQDLVSLLYKQLIVDVRALQVWLFHDCSWLAVSLQVFLIRYVLRRDRS